MVECFAELFANWEASVLLQGLFSFHYLKPAIFNFLLFVDCLLLKHVCSASNFQASASSRVVNRGSSFCYDFQ